MKLYNNFIGNENYPRPNPANPMEYCSTIPPHQQVAASGGATATPPSVMVPKGVLKPSDASNSGSSDPKSVSFHLDSLGILLRSILFWFKGFYYKKIVLLIIFNIIHTSKRGHDEVHNESEFDTYDEENTIDVSCMDHNSTHPGIYSFFREINISKIFVKLISRKKKVELNFTND